MQTAEWCDFVPLNSTETKINNASKTINPVIHIIMSRLFFPTPRIILLLCFFFFYFAAIPVSYSNNETDFHALVAFKNAIRSDPQGALNSWNETNHFCSWQGIFCGGKHQNRVVKIRLRSQGLMGPISPHIGNLSFLRSIHLVNNTFHGQIPNEIGRLRRLELVEFSNNTLSGEIPKNLSQCENLYWLDLYNNNLTGIIPLELTSLLKLESLGFSKNKLSGTIPPFIGNFTCLVQLSLYECGMQGKIPESLVQLKSLQNLFLSGNNLTGSIPPGLFNISTMSFFGVGVNRLEGIIPSVIGSTFSSLRALHLWGNLFSGEIPASLSNISSLEVILLQENNFKSRVNIDFSRLSAFRVLGLGEIILDGDLNFISSMINCTRLTVIDMASSQLSGLLPHSIANLSSSLTWLGIGGNKLHGSIPPGIGDLPNLSVIDLSENDLDGAIPSEIGKLKKLQHLHLDGNRFTNDIPSSFGNLTSLLYLHLQRNNFSGYVPQILSNCTNLLEFNISYNNLNGPIPPQVMSQFLSSNYLDMSHNALTGPVPVEVGSLVNLGLLDLSYNMLSGHVPSSLGSCASLEQIYFQSNSFDGEIPNGLRSMRGLQRVDFSQNNLSGTIPTFLGELDLLYLNLSFNRLEGRVPSRGVFLNESALSVEGNSDLCGGIPSLNFTPCSPENTKKQNHFLLVFKILIPVISVGAIALACYCMFVCMKGKSKHVQTSDMVSLKEGYLRISYGDLQKSTGGFSELNLLGAGKFGSVYKGILHDSQTSVAVKVLHLNVKGASKSFISECNVLGSIRHRNLVKILSVCSSTDFQKNDFKALVYEFMENGNLDVWLHHRPGDVTETLSLRQRLDIAIDIASALEYLHFGTDSTIVHGDLKPSNVLLDEEMTARIGDFGLAKIVSNILNESSTSFGIRGTIGYIPPEYGMSGVVSTQGDVYSYGILLLEIFTGRRPTDEEFEDFCGLPDFVRNALPRQVMEVLDPVIVQEYSHRKNVTLLDCVVSVLEIGLACSMKLPRDRMDMNDVVNQLQKASQMLAMIHY